MRYAVILIFGPLCDPCQEKKTKQLSVISAVEVTLPFVRVPRSGIKGKTPHLRSAGRWTLEHEMFAFQPEVSCCADQETCAMSPLGSCDSVLPLSGTWCDLSWGTFKQWWHWETRSFPFPHCRAQGSSTLQLPSHPLPSADPQIPLAGPAALWHVGGEEGRRLGSTSSPREEMLQGTGGGTAKQKRVRAMPGCSEQCDRWHKAGILQTKVVLAAANNFCVIWCCVYFKSGDQCGVSVLSFPSHVVFMTKKWLSI